MTFCNNSNETALQIPAAGELPALVRRISTKHHLLLGYDRRAGYWALDAITTKCLKSPRPFVQA
jgi:hypothetical protein